jgi:lysophospholipase L1-like esterase
MRLQKNDRLVMIGDSITDCGRARPVGEGLFEAIGKGYVALVEATLRAEYPELRLRVTNMGNSGNTVRDLKQRWDADVLALQPNWVSIMIGTNDVWRQFDLPLQQDCHVYPEEYAATLEELVVRTQPRVKGLVLMTPFYIECNTADAMRARMDQYGAIVKQTAEKHGTLFVDTQAAFGAVLKEYHSSAFAWDRVHPNMTGHVILAKAFLKAIGAVGK